MKLQGRTARRTDGQKDNLEPKRGDVERHPVSKHTLIALLALQYSQPNKIFSHNLPEDRQQSVSSWVAPAASACQANMHTETQNTHTVGSVSPSIFVFISIDLLVFKLAVHTHASSSCYTPPPSPFHTFSQRPLPQLARLPHGSGPFRVTHRGLRRIPYLKELCLCRPVCRLVCGGGEVERSLADDGRAGGRRENRGAEMRQRQTSAFAWHLHGANPRKCRNMRRRWVMNKVEGKSNE